MGIGVSILLLAIGAIITFATSVTVSGLDLDAVGVILMIAGGLGLLVSLVLIGTRRTDEVVERPVHRDGTV
jgi:hypothetical protein